MPRAFVWGMMHGVIDVQAIIFDLLIANLPKVEPALSTLSIGLAHA